MAVPAALVALVWIGTPRMALGVVVAVVGKLVEA